MTRVLNLQRFSSQNNPGVAPDSTSSDHNCACSTNSAAACIAGNEIAPGF